MSENEELLPCPNGHTKEVVGVGFLTVWANLSNRCENGEIYSVSCTCGWRGPSKCTEKAAIAAWNRRTQPAPGEQGGGEVTVEFLALQIKHLEAMCDPIGTSAAIHEYGQRLDALEAKASTIRETAEISINLVGDRVSALEHWCDEYARATNKRLSALEAQASHGFGTVKEKTE